MKNLISILLALTLLLSLVLTGCGTKAEKTAELTFATGSSTGTYYAFGGVIAQDVSANTDLTVTAVSSDGSKANILMLDADDAQLGFSQSDVMAYAYNGTSTFADEGAVEDFSVVAALYMEAVQIVTCDPAIKTVADLAGKKVSIGAAGSGVYFNAVDILGAYGLSEDDIIANYMNFNDSADSLTDGTIDAAFIVAGAPTTAITSLSASKDVFLVSIDEAHTAALIDASPYYSAFTVPAAAYGLEADVPTVAVSAVVLARDDVPDDAVYAFVSEIFEHSDGLAHEKAKELALDFAASVSAVPYHPGAARYFREKGIDVPAK